MLRSPFVFGSFVVLVLLAACDPDGPGPDGGGGGDDDGGPGDASRPDAFVPPRDAGVPIDGGDVCGDGVRGITEACEDSNADPDDGCSSTCEIEEGWRCPSVAGACRRIVCGDRRVEAPERCDDGNAEPDDGCSATCELEPGWACTLPGVACQAERCGDGIVAGFEQCDDGDSTMPGCDAECRLEPGFHCPTPGAACVATVCGDSLVQGLEQCDDGNQLIGDRCTPFCEREPDCMDGTCAPVCGDAQVFPGEDCDDGNTSDGDGCSASCVREDGYMCSVVTVDPPETLALPIVYRDFRASHSDFQEGSCGTVTGLVQSMWGADRKPVRASGAGCFTTNFAQWYVDSDASITIADRLTLTRGGTAPSFTYAFDETRFFPLTDRGWATMGEAQPDNQSGVPSNFHFTSELRFWFRYDAAAPAATLSFRGDDDVFVFINGRLAVDLGGVHGPVSASIMIDSARAALFGLADGGIYEAAVFQAERQTTGSNYRLELQNFFAGRSECESMCGDGVVTRDELCDDGPGMNTGEYGRCGADCRSRGPYCGDGETQSEHEQCDEGVDDNDGRYGGCNPDCTLGPRCGDGVRQGSEECDAGEMNGGPSCTTECRLTLL